MYVIQAQRTKTNWLHGTITELCFVIVSAGVDSCSFSICSLCTHNIGKTESEASDVACDRHMNVCVRELDCYSTAMLGTNECSNGSGRAHLTIQADECVCGTRIRCGTEKDKTVCSSRCTQCCCCSLNGAVLHQCTAKDLYTYQLLVLNARVFFMFISCSVDCCVFFFSVCCRQFSRLFTRMPHSSHVNSFFFLRSLWYIPVSWNSPSQEKCWNITDLSDFVSETIFWTVRILTGSILRRFYLCVKNFLFL